MRLLALAVIVSSSLVACSSDRLKSNEIPVHAFAVDVVGEGRVTSEPAGISCPDACDARFTEETTVVLVADARHEGGFSGWSGACEGAGTCVVRASAGKTVTARFKNRIDVSVIGAGRVVSQQEWIDCGTRCAALFDPGTPLRLTALPSAGTVFAGWTGACSGTAECALTVGASDTVAATFVPAQYQLEVKRAGSGFGRITSAPGGIDCGTACAASYAHGTVVTLTPAPQAGSVFSGFSGACTGQTCAVTMDAIKTVHARFEPAAPCQWAKRFGGNWMDRAGSLALSDDGRLLIGGSIFGAANLGAGPVAAPASVHSAFAATYGPDGSYRSAFWFGRSGAVTLGSSAAWSPDGTVALFGAFSGNVDLGNGQVASNISTAGMFRGFVGNYSTTGTYRWVQLLGATTVSSDGYGGIAVGKDGSVTATGEMFEPWSFGGPNTHTPKDSDLFLVQYDAAGAFKWMRAAGGDSYDRGQQLAFAPSGTWFVTGSFSGPANFGGGAHPPTASDDIVVAAYDANGGHAWDVALGTATGFDVGRAVAVMSDGDVIVAGGFTVRLDIGGKTLTSAGGSDAFVTRMSPAGAVRWAERLGGTGYEEAYSLAVALDGTIAVVGEYYGDTQFAGVPAAHRGEGDVFFARYTADGTLLSTRAIGGAGTDRARGVAFDKAGNLLLAGEFEETFDTGVGVLTSAGGTDIFLACVGR